MSGTRLAYIAAVALFAGLLLRHHHTIVTMPIPLDLYEGTMPFITGIIAQGHNPYTLAFQPQAADVYPPLYNILVAPLTHVFPNDLVLHRAVSAVFIVATCALFGFVTWRRGRDLVHASAAAVAIYAGLVFYSTPVASTNALGVLLFSMSVCIPWLARFSAGSLAVSAALGVLAFYAKQYCILGVAIVCLYVFLFVSVRRALALGAGFAASLLLSLVIVDRTSPYFLDNTLFSTTIAVSALSSWSIMGLQLLAFARIHAGYLAIVVLLALAGLRGVGPWTGAGCDAIAFQPRGRWGRGPLLRGQIDFFCFAFFWSSLAVMLTIGRNPGNYMTYLFQLMSPFLLVGVFSVLPRLPRTSWWPLPLVLLGFCQAYLFLPRDFSYDARPWERTERLVRDADQVLSTQMLVMMLLENGKEIHQDGHTFYFPLAAGKPAMFRRKDGPPEVEQVWSRYIAGLYRRIERREFDLVIVSPWEMQGIFGRHPPPGSELDGHSFLEKHYAVSETITLSMTDRQGGGTWDLQVWKPRNMSGTASSGDAGN